MLCCKYFCYPPCRKGRGDVCGLHDQSYGGSVSAKRLPVSAATNHVKDCTEDKHSGEAVICGFMLAWLYRWLYVCVVISVVLCLCGYACDYMFVW